MARKEQHATFRALLAARLDRPLTRVESRALTSHLKGCASCQQVDAEYRANRAQLRALAQPLPPRDMWARTSAALDREVARGASVAWGRRVRRARRRANPSSALMSSIAAVGVIAALAVFQLAPALSPAPNSNGRPTPFAVDPQPLAFVGLGATDLAIYRMTVSEVCPQTATLDCVESHKIVRTTIGAGLPYDIQADNAALSPTGEQLVLVGKQRDSDVIAVVMLPANDGSFTNPTESVELPESTETPGLPQSTPEATPPSPTEEPDQTPAPTADVSASDQPEPSATPAVTPGEEDTPTPGPSDEPTPAPAATPAGPPESAVPGLAVISILEDVRSAGSAPAWSRNGSMLAFSAMPVDGSHGPDVYVWSPNDTLARPITDDHASFFASWSGNRIVVSRLISSSEGGVATRNFVVDPNTLEERRVRSGQVWLPTVNRQRTQAIAWQGQMGTSNGLPELRSGALVLMPWAAVDPFADAPSPQGTPDPGASPDVNAPAATAVPLRMTQLDPDGNMSSSSVADWQAGWSPDGRVLGIWVADSVGSSWGRLTVLAIDPETGLIADGEPLLPTTLARNGFSLGVDRVAWVAPSDQNVDGELRLRAWTSDGVGGLRVISPEQEGVLPAS